MPTISEVDAARDSEFAYQKQRWGDAGKDHEIASWILYMQHELGKAAALASSNSPETPALDQIRKTIALGYRCMMEHGAPFRDMPPHTHNLG